jgi:hypothetical protein
VVSRTPHRFGGAWTDEKLKVLDGYLSAYTTALKNSSLSKGPPARPIESADFLNLFIRVASAHLNALPRSLRYAGGMEND